MSNNLQKPEYLSLISHTPHASKRWYKKIKEKLDYFGIWADPNGTLKEYLQDKDGFQAGNVPLEHGRSKPFRRTLGWWTERFFRGGEAASA